MDRNVRDKEIVIHIDNQAAIRALGKYEIESKLVATTKKDLNELGNKNKIRLRWVPGHSRITGNSIADGLARLGSSNPLDRARLELEAPRSYLREEIRQWGKKQHQKRWDRRTTCRQTAMILPKVEGKAWKLVSKMNRRGAMYVTQIITGHNSLKRHLNIMGIEEYPTCEKCQQEPETMKKLTVIKQYP